MSVASSPPGHGLSASELSRTAPNPKEWKAVAYALQHDSPRSAALLGAAHVDNTLEHELRRDFIALPVEEYEKLFRPGSGPLSSTEAKIHLAYCLGAFGEITRNDLVRIVKIRNLFAHSAHAITFDTMTIRNLCFELKALKAYEANGIWQNKDPAVNIEDPRELYIRTCLDVSFTVFFERHTIIVNGIKTTQVKLKMGTPALP